MFKISLDNLLNSAYGIDLDRLFDLDNFYFDGIELSDSDVYNKEIREKYSHLDDEEFFKVAKRAAFDRYVYTYIDEYSEEAIKILEDKIRFDLNNLGDIFSEYDEFTGEGTISVHEIDWDNREITIEGDIETLACYVLNAINGYGMFVYESLDDFWYANSAKTFDEKLQAVEGHFHWLKHVEDIYGTGEGFFLLDTSKIGQYSYYGDYDYTEEDFIEAMDLVL